MANAAGRDVDKLGTKKPTDKKWMDSKFVLGFPQKLADMWVCVYFFIFVSQKSLKHPKATPILPKPAQKPPTSHISFERFVVAFATFEEISKARKQISNKTCNTNE